MDEEKDKRSSSAKKPQLVRTTTSNFGDDFSEDEDAKLNEDNLAELLEEQGIRGIPEVDVPPEFESDDDIPIGSGEGEGQVLEDSTNSLNIHQRSETRQNRNLKTGSASSDRPFSGKLSTQLSTADVIEAAETLDDFEEEERQVQKELETSQDERYYSSSVQNRQEDFMNDQDIPMDDEYDSDYPDGLGMPMEYPTDPPPAYTSPTKHDTKLESDRDSMEDDEDDEESDQHFMADKPGIGGALLAGGMALAGIANSSPPKKVAPTPERPSSEESYKYNDAIQDHTPEMSARGNQLPPLDDEASLLSARQKSSAIHEDEEEEEGSPEAIYPMTSDLKALLAVVELYHVPNIEIEPYLVPFDINYIAAVGDVHPGFGIPRPDGLEDHLGLVVLDEPAGKQSNSTVINMLLTKDQAPGDVPVKQLQRADRNTRQIDQWIENIKEVRRSRPADRITYNKPMPDIEKLMEEWNPELDSTLSQIKLPTAAIDATTEEYADICLAVADIPVHNNSRIQSLHLLFSLYNEFKNSQHFRNIALDGGHGNIAADRLEL